MSSTVARSESSSLRILVLEHGGETARPYEVFDLIEIVEGDHLLRVRSPFLFEIGEELSVRVKQGDTVYEAHVRVRGHGGPDRTTELEILERSEPRRMVTG